MSLECPICLGLLKVPVVTSCCGNTFCSKCLKNALWNNETCPVCRKPIDIREDVIRNRTVEDLVATHRKHLKSEKKIRQSKKARKISMATPELDSSSSHAVEMFDTGANDGNRDIVSNAMNSSVVVVVEDSTVMPTSVNLISNDGEKSVIDSIVKSDEFVVPIEGQWSQADTALYVESRETEGSSAPPLALSRAARRRIRKNRPWIVRKWNAFISMFSRFAACRWAFHACGEGCICCRMGSRQNRPLLVLIFLTALVLLMTWWGLDYSPDERFSNHHS